LAAIAGALAISTKFTVSASLAVLTLAVSVYGWRHRRRSLVLLWWGACVVFGSYWLLRNWAAADNPLPYYRAHFGPVDLPSAMPKRGDAFASYFFDWSRWQGFFGPGFRRALTPLWPAVFAGAFAGVGLGLRRSRQLTERWCALAYGVGLIAYVFTPFTADGGGLAFSFNVRYVTPALLGALVLFAVNTAPTPVILRRALTLSMLAIVGLAAAAKHYERVPAWPSIGRVAAVVGAIVIVGGAILLAARPQLRPGAITLGTSVVVAIALCWPLEHRYEDNRYVHTNLSLDTIFTAFHPVRHERVAFFGLDESYPLYGVDLSNRVTHPRPPAVATCAAWFDVLRAGHFTYVAVAHEPFAATGPDPAWIAADDNARTVVADDTGAVYRFTGPPAGSAC
jgi:hypothetical protein